MHAGPIPTGHRAAVVGRRRFVQGAALLGAAAGLGGVMRPARALVPAGSPMPMLQGDRFDLSIGRMPVNFTGRNATAIAVNGSVPAPILRWRQGDTVDPECHETRCAVPTLDPLAWHPQLQPTMDGVPGAELRAASCPGETFTYRIPLHQSGTYWYHSHSGFPRADRSVWQRSSWSRRHGYAQAFRS